MTLRSLFRTNKLIALAFTLTSSHVSANDACLEGLFAVDRYAEQGKNSIYHIDLENKSYSSCLLYTSPSPRDRQKSRMPSSA